MFHEEKPENQLLTIKVIDSNTVFSSHSSDSNGTMTTGVFLQQEIFTLHWTILSKAEHRETPEEL